MTGDARTFFAIGSFAIWISTSCPSLSSSLICGTTVFSRLRKRVHRRGVRGLDRFPRSGPRSGARRWVRCTSMASGAGPRTTALASTVPSPIASASNNASAPLAPLRVPIPRLLALRLRLGLQEQPREALRHSLPVQGLPPRSGLHHIRSRSLSAGRVRLFFRLLETVVVTRLFSIGRKVDLFLLDLLLFHRAVAGRVHNFMRKLSGMLGKVLGNFRSGRKASSVRRIVFGRPQSRVILDLRSSLVARFDCFVRFVPDFGCLARSAQMRFVAMMNFRLQRVLMFVKRLGSHGGSGADPSLAKIGSSSGKFAGWRRKRSVPVGEISAVAAAP